MKISKICDLLTVVFAQPAMAEYNWKNVYWNELKGKGIDRMSECRMCASGVEIRHPPPLRSAPGRSVEAASEPEWTVSAVPRVVPRPVGRPHLRLAPGPRLPSSRP